MANPDGFGGTAYNVTNAAIGYYFGNMANAATIAAASATANATATNAANTAAANAATNASANAATTDNSLVANLQAQIKALTI